MQNSSPAKQGKVGNFSPPTGKRSRFRVSLLCRGSMIIELALAMALLTGIGLVIFKGSLDIMAPRQWVIHQNLSDAYLTYEEAYAQRISFEELTSIDSPWPEYPKSSRIDVEIGKLPGGTPILATIIRTRMPNSNNLSAAGGIGNTSSNPSEMQTWQLQSHLSYKISDAPYVKSRNTIRSQ